MRAKIFLPGAKSIFACRVSLPVSRYVWISSPVTAAPLPEIEISWLQPEQDLPEARRLSQGYTLHLNLQPLAPNKMSGEFHLILPPQYRDGLMSGKLATLYRSLALPRWRTVDTQFRLSRHPGVCVGGLPAAAAMSAAMSPLRQLPASQFAGATGGCADRGCWLTARYTPLALTLKQVAPFVAGGCRAITIEQLPASLAVPVAQIAAATAG